jgi:hypothetical protein
VPTSPDFAQGKVPDSPPTSLPIEDEKTRSRRSPLRLSLAAIALGGLLMIGTVVWMVVTQQGLRLVPGPLVADHNTHLIESVRSDKAAPTARFPLQARGAPLVTEVNTDLPCASARLVQGDQTSRWYGFSHPNEPLAPKDEGEQFAGVQMLPFQPAYLEVRIDPKTHILDGDQFLTHDVVLKTQDGQVLNFEVTTDSK